jgi:hypothetical protein
MKPKVGLARNPFCTLLNSATVAGLSFDQYRNFEIRGTKFRDLVTAIPGVKPVV